MKLPVRQIPLPNEPDSTAILKVLEQLRVEYSRNPLVWQTALQIIGRVGNNAQMEQADRLARYVREKMIYVKDPDTGEFVTAPDILIGRINSQGYAQGDCDDHALLFNSLLGTVGIPTRFAGVKLPGSHTWNHVVSNFQIGPQWFEMDTCSKKGTRLIFTSRLTVI
jgi:transglutaminase-like putative cysteine protease